MAKDSAGKLVTIEAGRGLAATMVVLYHGARHLDEAYRMPNLMKIFQFGHAGVDFFFVVSGFIILFAHYDDVGRPGRFLHYCERRFVRLMPTYWAALALTVAMGAAGTHALPSAFDIAWSATLLPANADPILGVAWTLRYEIIFYAAFGLLLLDQFIGLIVLIAWFSGVALATAGIITIEWLPNSMLSAYNFEFFLGMGVAQWSRNNRLPRGGTVLTAGLVLFAISAICEDAGLIDGYANPARFIYGSSSALTVLGAVEAGRSGLVVVPGTLRTLGTASYSIYLFQFIFIGILWKIWLLAGLDRLMPPIACFPLLVAGALLGGVFASRLIEYPLMNLVRGRLRQAFA